MKRRVADIIVDTLIENGVTDCFAVVGGGAMHIDNALAINNSINKVFNHHEQACAMAAEGYAKATGKIALVSVTSGPGALNTLNGVEGAYVDNVPMIVISGHPRWDTTVNYSGLDLRYRGVQEFDIVPAIKGMTKYSKTVLDPLSIKREVKKAIDIAMDGRKGPTWLSVPLDVQGTFVNIEDLLPYEDISSNNYTLDSETIVKINNLIKKSMKPVILSGSGIRTGGEIDRFREWIKMMKIPTVSGSLLPDILHEGFPYYYGTSGTTGERAGNFILQNSDLIITIGNSLALKQTGFNQKLFAPHSKIVMIDAGQDETKKPGLTIELPVYCDAKTFFDIAFDQIKPWDGNVVWYHYCDTIKEKLGDIDAIPEASPDSRVSNQYFWEIIRNSISDNTMIALGNSSGVVGCLQHSIKKPHQRVIVNYNSGSMGDDLPEAIGMYVGSKKDILCVTGDGSIMMNLQELQTIKHYNMPIKIVILSNDGYGAIRQTNRNFFNGVYIGCDKHSGVSMPDFEKIAYAFDYKYRLCSKMNEVQESVGWLLSQSESAILEVKQLIDDPVIPKVMSKMNEDGTFSTPGLQDMYPYISDDLMNELMNI